ncbi:MAG: hypothetical protein IPK55_12920 [Streptococcus sp.]|nr:hypothetical protein [Streptococcus sp.]
MKKQMIREMMILSWGMMGTRIMETMMMSMSMMKKEGVKAKQEEERGVGMKSLQTFFSKTTGQKSS